MYEWDENKRLQTIAKRGLDLADAYLVFEDLHRVNRPARTVGAEQRQIAIGMLDGVHVAVVFTMRERVTRIITMRRARHEEREHYQKIHSG